MPNVIDFNGLKVCSVCGTTVDVYGSNGAKRRSCRPCDRRRSAERRTAYPVRMLLITARYRAKRGGIPFTITEADIPFPLLCPCFGEPLVKGSGVMHSFSPSVDRIDPTLGYVPGNVQVISYKANAMKQNATWPELLCFAKWIFAMAPTLKEAA